MSTESMFITAARKKYRFDSSKGPISVEDVWGLPLASLDGIAIALDEQITQAGRKSFVAKRTTANVDLETKLEILKFVIETKQAEDDARKTRAENEQKRQLLLSLRERKTLSEMEGLTTAEIDQKLAALV